MSNDKDKDYWFRAKKYGWGWDFPRKWQGWVVLVVYIVGITVAGSLLEKQQGIGLFLSVVAAQTLILFLVCWKTGEPPKWRWGDKKE